METRDMNRELEAYEQFANDACESAINACDCSRIILKKWKPKKEFGLSKKESRAAFIGFALGLFNGADAVMLGRHFKCDEHMRKRVLKAVSEFIGKDDDGDNADSDAPSDSDVRVEEIPGMQELIELLFGNGTQA